MDITNCKDCCYLVEKEDGRIVCDNAMEVKDVKEIKDLQECTMIVN
jgi:hypothetical protein